MKRGIMRSLFRSLIPLFAHGGSSFNLNFCQPKSTEWLKRTVSSQITWTSPFIEPLNPFIKFSVEFNPFIVMMYGMELVWIGVDWKVRPWTAPLAVGAGCVVRKMVGRALRTVDCATERGGCCWWSTSIWMCRFWMWDTLPFCCAPLAAKASVCKAMAVACCCWRGSSCRKDSWGCGWGSLEVSSSELTLEIAKKKRKVIN